MVADPVRYAKPSPGDEVTVTTRYPNRYYFTDSEWDVRVYSGRVIPDDRWTRADCFVLQTSDTKFPIRTIALDHVHSIKYSDGSTPKAALADEQFKTWEVLGSKGDSYKVTKTGNKFKCSCAGFSFRNRCKHIESIR